jgi:hypothetical protein
VSYAASQLNGTDGTETTDGDTTGDETADATGDETAALPTTLPALEHPPNTRIKITEGQTRATLMPLRRTAVDNGC